MTHKGRVQKLEEKIQPKKSKYKIAHFYTRYYDNRSELEKDIEKWKIDNPLGEGEQHRIFTHNVGFKGEKLDE